MTCLMLSATREKAEANCSHSPASLRATTTPPGSTRSAILSSQYEKQPVTVFPASLQPHSTCPEAGHHRADGQPKQTVPGCGANAGPSERGKTVPLRPVT